MYPVTRLVTVGWLARRRQVRCVGVECCRTSARGQARRHGRVAEEDPPVGPFDLQCAVEPLDLAVLPRAVRLDEPVLNAELGNRLLDGGGVPVGPGVVGDQSLNPGNPVGGEVGGSAEQEPTAQVVPISSVRISE